MQSPVKNQVLIVGFSESESASLRALLPDRSCQSVSVADGTEAMVSLSAHPPAAMLINARLTGPLEGLSLCALIKNHPELKGIPIALRLEDDSVFESTRAHLAGADRVFTRAAGAQEASAVVATLLGI